MLCRLGLCAPLGSPTCGVGAVSTCAALQVPMQPYRYPCSPYRYLCSPYRYLCNSTSTCAALQVPAQPYRFLCSPIGICAFLSVPVQS